MESAGAGFSKALCDSLASWKVAISAGQSEFLRGHFESMVEANRVMNLTRITDPVEAAVKHYADSLALIPWLRLSGLTVDRLLDIGTGAGFPSFPLAVMLPETQITALEATRKKVDFLAATASRLAVQNLRVVHGHSAHWEGGGRVPLVVGRAVAKLGKWLDNAAKHVAPGGSLVAYKSARLSAEEEADVARFSRRRGRDFKTFSYTLALGGERIHRMLVIV